MTFCWTDPCKYVFEFPAHDPVVVRQQDRDSLHVTVSLVILIQSYYHAPNLNHDKPHNQNTIMKTKLMSLFIALSFLGGAHRALAQYPVITSFSQNGVLTCSNTPGSLVTVQWASSNAGPWQSDWSSLSTLTAGTSGIIQVSVPMFYRVLACTNPPAGMALIPAGTYTMGDTLDGNPNGDAAPVSVFVSAFYMDTNLVSYGQWQEFFTYGNTSHGYVFSLPGSAKGGSSINPVQSIYWYDAVKWCNARSQAGGLTPVYYTDAGFTQVYTNGLLAPFVNWAANGYRLPTEAEWEVAARGGLTGKRFPWGGTSNTISQYQANYVAETTYSYDLGPNYGNYSTNYPGYNGVIPSTSPVASFAPNGYGLYDMAGNVRAWCWDWYGTPYAGGNNPTGPTNGTYRVQRGGSWDDVAPGLTCAERWGGYVPNQGGNYVGLRCVRKF